MFIPKKVFVGAIVLLITFGCSIRLAAQTQKVAASMDAALVNQLVTYPAPKGSELNTDFSVSVRKPGGAWQPVATYLVKVAVVTGDGRMPPTNSSMSYFDFAGAVEILITSNRGSIESARIRPLSVGLKSELKDNTLTFSLAQPSNLSIEVNGDIFRNLQLFANPIEPILPDPKDPDVIYFGPGVHVIGEIGTPVGLPAPPVPPRPEGSRPVNPARAEAFREMQKRTFRVPTGKTVYIAGGAIIRGRILCDQAENVRIIGRGMVEQSILGGGIRISNSRNIEVSGIFTQQCFTGGSQHVTITNVKCISYVRNGDGMNVISSSDVLIDGVFNRNSDDCITVYGTRLGFTGGASRIVVQNSTLWADVAHPILVGTHGNTPNPDTLEELRFSNLDILDHAEPQLDYQGCLSLNAGDSNLIRNVRFEDIRIEDFRQGQLVNLRVFYNRKYCTSPGRGIENVYLKNITYTGSHASHSVIEGYDDARLVKNIVFENLTINGKSCSWQMERGHYAVADLAGMYVGPHVEGIEFLPLGGAKEPPPVPRPRPDRLYPPPVVPAS